MKGAIKMNRYSDVYTTKDFYLACFLKTKGLQLVEVIKEDKVAVFSFKLIEEFNQIITDFYNGNEKVSAIAFINSIRDLKAFIHNI